MKELRVAILWHHHQPYYRRDDEFVLPWVRLHAVKDYLDLAALHWEFPSLRLTYNIVPSLLIQLKEYADGVEDTVLRLTKIGATELTLEQKEQILRSFFQCNHATMLQPYARYNELYTRSLNNPAAVTEFEVQDWRDLQVWYNLTWIGALSREQKSVQMLFEKGRDFTEDEKSLVLAQHRLILRSVVPMLQELFNAGLAELSMTPLHHPILPLVVDSDVAREATPEVVLPTKRYRQTQDAEWQLRRGEQIFSETFNTSPKGVWCSEGSVSNDVVQLLTQCGFSWTATDEQVLRHSLGENYRESDQYFVHRYSRERRQPIDIFFRDHHLSDAIGFVYQQWDAEHASDDFIRRLHEIRQRILDERGEEALESAVVPIILDGENCWEYYQDNGVHFLRALYRKLTSDPLLRTVRFNDVIGDPRTQETMPILQNLVAGSWIHGNFNIWIGNEEKNEAWDQLHAARLLIDAKRVTKKQWQTALEHIYIAEGSDWFWWYGDDHRAESRHVFDELFRYHLRCVYELYHAEVPLQIRRSMMKDNVRNSEFSTMHAAASP